MRLFTPAFGAGAVGGYTVLRLAPAIVVPERTEQAEPIPVPEQHTASSRKTSERRSEGDAKITRLAIVNRGQAVAWEQPGAPVTPRGRGASSGRR